MPRRKSDPVYRSQLNIKYHHTIGYIGLYLTSKTKLFFICYYGKKNHYWWGYPGKVLAHGCPYCNRRHGVKIRAKECRKSNAKFQKQMWDVWHGQIIAISKYRGWNHPVHFKCTVCGHKWWSFPSNLLEKHSGCKKCSERLNRFNHKPIIPKSKCVAEINHIWHGKIFLIGNYSGITKEATFGCIHGHKFSTEPRYVIAGSGCPHCVSYRGEIAVANYLKDHGCKEVYNARLVKKHSNTFCHQYNIKYDHKNLRYDFLWNDHGKLYVIEFDGVQHFFIEDFSGHYRKLVKAHASKAKIAFAKLHLQQRLLTQLQHDFLKETWSLKNLKHPVIRIENVHGYQNINKINKLVKQSILQSPIESINLFTSAYMIPIMSIII